MRTGKRLILEIDLLYLHISMKTKRRGETGLRSTDWQWSRISESEFKFLYVCINVRMYVCMYACRYERMYVWGSIRHDVAWWCVSKGIPLVEVGETPALDLPRPSMSNRRHWLLCRFSSVPCSEQLPSSTLVPDPIQSQLNPAHTVTSYCLYKIHFNH